MAVRSCSLPETYPAARTTSRIITQWHTTAAVMNECHTSWYPNVAGLGSGLLLAKMIAPAVYRSPPATMRTIAGTDSPCTICGSATRASQPAPMYRIAVVTWRPSIFASFSVIPTAAVAHASESITTDHAP